LRNQIWKGSQIGDRRCAESFGFRETFVDRREIIFWRKPCLLGVNHADPIRKRFRRRDFATQTGVIKMAMRVDQSRQQRLLAKIDNFTGVALFDLIKLPNIDNLISGNGDCAVLDGCSIHRHDCARTNDHLSAVAAVYDRRQTLIANGVTAVAPGGSAPPKTMAILAENAVFLEHDPAQTQLGVKNQGKAAFVANALRTTRSTLATDLKRFRLL